MKRTAFVDGWQFREKVNPFAELGGSVSAYRDVVVPHDAMLTRERSPQAPQAQAFFPDGVYQYRKTFELPEGDLPEHVVLEFEGVYRDAMVYVNGALAGQHPYGYSGFYIDASAHVVPGTNQVSVEVRTHDDSRWYTGAGIYRDVWLWTSGHTHIALDGLRVTASEIDEEGALVEVATTIEHHGSRLRTVRATVTLTSPDGETVARGTTPVSLYPGSSAVARHRLYVTSPSLWSAESPTLYHARVQLLADEDTLDEAATNFGIRRLQLDPHHGLRVNGASVKLRGASIHHDNGILGAATFADAEYRRVRLLKEAGFNAIRSAHNPLSKAALDACDRYGMYVMDETFDVWTSGKGGYDYSLHFAEWWERDVSALVAKDFNHPSVILYSIGNEIPEVGSPAGAATGRALAEKVRELDPTRYVTNAINGMLAVMDDIIKMAAERSQNVDEGTGINTLMSGPGEFMNQIGSSPLVTDRTEESFGLLDIAGMNYLDARYESDHERFPNRLIIGTETFPTRIDHNWRIIKNNPHVFGDFTWTGWDYLGEVGLGRMQYAGEDTPPQPTHSGPFPWIAAWCGDLDITGSRRPASFYREIVFGLQSAPYIAVQRPEHHGKTQLAGPWTWSDSIGSWTWHGFEGAPITVEVYSDAEEVELLLNGQSLGRVPAGEANRFRSEFETSYTPGQLVAVAYQGGQEVGRSTLRSAGEFTGLALKVDEPAISAAGGLGFVTIELVDADGLAVACARAAVTVEVDGPAELIALGSANPVSDESFQDERHTTFDGTALAVVRTTGEGTITVTVRTDGMPAAKTELTAQ
ncbi:beta-galactosidase [Kibdelosporangium banguiense]|uniref:Beta-galactosidase n=1 Tax=Kibdelosporangium banguiense TaxID=1365924 RepID=A0ABS4TY38_9PSEU|nr:glycoside hydrolase family 2 TIM barrel-domain containing protein [Kibdelosporangium banguiense]MBP2328928.1 beta-galactosidase [Kibdelosporangium banguiense]